MPEGLEHGSLLCKGRRARAQAVGRLCEPWSHEEMRVRAGTRKHGKEELEAYLSRQEAEREQPGFGANLKS